MSLTGQYVGKYQIGPLLGMGGMAEVYAGEHVDAHLGRRVAIKVLLAEHCTNTEVVNRFMNEARALGRINHPGVVSIYDVARLADGRVAIIMEFLQGQTMYAWVQARGPFPLTDALHVMLQLADTMAAAHDQNIIHRDIKPENIFLIPDQAGVRTKILDFGVAKLVGEGSLVSTSATTRLGTAPYMSPEQFRSSKDVDHRSDMYSLGCTFFELLTGRPPFIANNLVEYMRAHAYEPPPPLRALAPGALPSVEQVINRMLAKDPADRFGSMRDLKHVLEIIQSGGVPDPALLMPGRAVGAAPTHQGVRTTGTSSVVTGKNNPSGARRAVEAEEHGPRWGIIAAIAAVTVSVALMVAVLTGIL